METLAPDRVSQEVRRLLRAVPLLSAAADALGAPRGSDAALDPSAQSAGQPRTVAEVVAKCDRASTEIAQGAKSMAAFADQLAGEQALPASEFDPNGEQYRELAEAESDFSVHAQAHLRASKQVPPHLVPIRRAYERLYMACRAMAASCRSLRGAVQAHDANFLTMRHAAREPSQTPEALKADLQSIIGR
jgi:hypothetical protein